MKLRRKTLVSALFVLLIVSIIPVGAQMTPTIDGVISSGEWGEVDFTGIGYKDYEGYEVYVQNDLDYLYVAFVGQPGADYQSSGGTSICVYPGDDYAGECWVYEPSGPDLTYYTTHHIQPPIVIDGKQVLSTTSVVGVGLNVMEWKIPLDEISAKPGDTIAFDLYSYMEGFSSEETAWIYEVYYTLWAPNTVDLTATVIEPPVADAGGPYSGYVNRPIRFDGSGSVGEDLSYAWDFGDGGTATVESPSHTYTVADTYTVTLTVTDDEDLTDSDITTVTVREERPPSMGSTNKPPVADAGPDQTVYFDETVIFNGSASYDPDGSIMSYEWDFGDGKKATGAEVSHVYSDMGSYTATLTVKDYRNAEASDTCLVTVTEETKPTPPTPEPAAFILFNLTITPAEVEPGEEVSISFVVTNVGEETGVCTVTLSVEGTPTTFVVALDGGKSEKLEHHVSPETEGTYQVEVDDLSGSFTVKAPPTPIRPAEFSITGLTVSPTEVMVDDQVTVSVTVTNIGEETGECVVVLKTTLGADSWEVSNYHTVDGGESETSAFTLTPNVEGIYTVDVNGLLGSFTATAPPGVLSPGYVAGILILIIVAGGTIYYLYRGGRLSLS